MRARRRLAPARRTSARYAPLPACPHRAESLIALNRTERARARRLVTPRFVLFVCVQAGLRRSVELALKVTQDFLHGLGAAAAWE